MVEHIHVYVLYVCDVKSHLSAFQFWKKAVLGFVSRCFLCLSCHEHT